MKYKYKKAQMAHNRTVTTSLPFGYQPIRVGGLRKPQSGVSYMMNALCTVLTGLYENRVSMQLCTCGIIIETGYSGFTIMFLTLFPYRVAGFRRS
jgi:hypothetical protein